MCLLVCRLAIISILGFSSSFSFAQRGQGTSSGGGGGSTIQFKGQRSPFLLDRLTLNPDLARRSDVTSAIANPLPQAENPGQKLSVLKREDIKTVLELADARLKFWADKFKAKPLTDSTAVSLGLISLIRQTLAGMTFLRTPLRFKLIDRYQLSPLLSRERPDIQMAILYLPRYGAIISEVPWNAVDIETQAGLLIHESLRQIQGAFGYNDLTDRALQAIVAKIVDGTPGPDENFVPFLIGSPRFLNRSLVTGYQQPGLLNSNLNAQDVAIGSLATDLASQLDDMITGHQIQNARQVSDKTTAAFLQELVAVGILKDSF